jgi:glycosyltransferase involved in cell wall biosynthesis
MRVLNLVVEESAPFFQQQEKILERRGIECETIEVPGSHDTEHTRTATDYLRFHAPVLKKSRQFDVVHANYGLTGPAALLQPTRPVVLSLWGSDLLGWTGPLSKACARLSDAVIVMSDEMAEAYGGDCEVIPHGIDMRLFEPRSTREAREEVGWRHDARHVLFPYSPDRELKDHPRAERVVDGVNDAFDETVELHAVHGVPHDSIPTYMNAADALLMTSKREGSPNTVKEALACNLPVVSTDVGDVRNLLSGVDPSFACETDEELVDALAETLRRGERSNGRETVEHLRLETMGERIEDVYRSALESR